MILDSIKNGLPKPCKEGYPFIGIGAVITVLFALVDWDTLALAALGITIWIVYFFRDPERVTPEGGMLVVSPADGMISKITEAVPPAELDMGDEPLTRISVFLNVFNVHINRVPAAGKITALHYHPGKFLNAELDKASEDNERQLCKVTTSNGKDVGFVQIAGFIARRIVCYLQDDQEVKTGERFGLIRFGSRMDVFLPKGIAPLVVEGQIAVGGETIFADMKGKQPEARTGNVH